MTAAGWTPAPSVADPTLFKNVWNILKSLCVFGARDSTFKDENDVSNMFLIPLSGDGGHKSRQLGTFLIEIIETQEQMKMTFGSLNVYYLLQLLFKGKCSVYTAKTEP